MVKSSSTSSNSGKSLIFSFKKVRYQKIWKKEEDDELIRLARRNNERNWKEIASHFVNKNPLQCFSRYKRIKPGIKKGSWTKEEDERIVELVKKYDRCWSKISKELKTRNGKQIRDRYLNVLDPNIDKTKFTEEDDERILKYHEGNGPRWGLIATFFQNRTADMIKNRFHSSIKKKLTPSGRQASSYPSSGSRTSMQSRGRVHYPNATSTNNHQLYQEDRNETKECTGVFDTDFFAREGSYEGDPVDNWSNLNSMTDNC